MKRSFFFFLVVSVFFTWLKSETVDVSTSVPAQATLLGVAEMSVVVRNVSDDVATSTVTWGSVPSTTTYKEANQYIEVNYNDNYFSWAIRIYTNNTDWGGSTTTSRGGLIHTATNTVRLPLLWQVYDEKEDGVQCSTTTGWAYIKDKNDPDWDDAATSYANICYGGPDYCNLANFPSDPPRTDSDNQDVYIYLGGEFKSASGGDYSGNICFDLYHQ